jgi:general nucleoside transport system permease protein
VIHSAEVKPGSSLLRNKTIQVVVRYGLMILLAFLLFAGILLVTGKNPVQSYRDLFAATFGSAYGFSEVIVAMIPILLTALAVALPARIGLINVGAEGQLFMGAVFATFAALAFKDLPSWILLPIMTILGVVGGALWGLLPAYFKSIGLVNETITSLLMNSVAPKIAGLLVYGFWHSARETNMTPSFVAAARLPAFFGTRIHFGLVFGLVLLAVFWFVMKRTRWGLEMRAIGGNGQAARRNGIPIPTYMILVFCIGGGIAGLAGMAQVSGFYGLLIPNFSPGYGYMGFLISWLAGGDPLGILFMAFVVSIILTGGNMLQITAALPYAVINLLLAITLFVVLARPSLPKFRKGKEKGISA